MSIGDWFSLVDGATFVLIVCLLNLLPLAYELSLHALVWCGVDVTAFSHLNQVTRCVDALTGLGERGLLLTVALFIGTRCSCLCVGAVSMVVSCVLHLIQYHVLRFDLPAHVPATQARRSTST